MAYSAVFIIAAAANTKYQADKQEQFQERQERIQGSNDASRRFSQRRRMLREQRIKTAQIQQAAENTGVAASSGAISSVGTLSTDFAFNQGILKSEERLSAESFNAARSFAKSATKSAISGVILSGVQSQLKFQGLPDYAGAGEDLDDIFSDPSLF